MSGYASEEAFKLLADILDLPADQRVAELTALINEISVEQVNGRTPQGPGKVGR